MTALNGGSHASIAMTPRAGFIMAARVNRGAVCQHVHQYDVETAFPVPHEPSDVRRVQTIVDQICDQVPLGSRKGVRVVVVQPTPRSHPNAVNRHTHDSHPISPALTRSVPVAGTNNHGGRQCTFGEDGACGGDTHNVCTRQSQVAVAQEETRERRGRHSQVQHCRCVSTDRHDCSICHYDNIQFRN